MVCQNNLFEKAKYKYLNPGFKRLQFNTTILSNLWEEIFPSHYRPSGQFREERDVESNVQDAFFCFILFPINVNQICQRTENVKADTHWENNVQRDDICSN